MSAPTYRMETVEVTQPSDWNDLIEHLEDAHALQTWQWGQVKAQVGWQSHPLVWRDEEGTVCAGALLLQRVYPNRRIWAEDERDVHPPRPDAGLWQHPSGQAGVG